MNGHLVLAVLALAGCSASAPYAIPGVTADGFRRPFEAIGAICHENPGGLDSGWNVSCSLDPSPACEGPDCPQWFAAAQGGGKSQITGMNAQVDLASPGALGWLLALAEVQSAGSDPEAARRWVSTQFNDPACASAANPIQTWSIVIGHTSFTLVCDKQGRRSAGLWRGHKDNPDP